MSKVAATVFYSWQSDIPGAANRSLIQAALERGAKEIASDDSIKVEPVIDRDTLNTAGSPDIGTTILSKIKAADIVVADVTIINPGSSLRLTPNPNVMVEVGYALAVHTESRLILVNNLAFGQPEELPFDLRQKRILCYRSEPQSADRAADRRALQASLRNAIGAVLKTQGVVARIQYPCRLSLSYRVEKQTQDLHEYVLQIRLENVSERIINNWHVEVELPTALVLKPASHICYVADRSNQQESLFRFTHEGYKGPIYPGDSLTMTISYYMNWELFKHRSRFLEQPFVARAFADGAVAAEEVRKIASEMQNF
jgi:hypothetical protein